METLLCTANIANNQTFKHWKMPRLTVWATALQKRAWRNQKTIWLYDSHEVQPHPELHWQKLSSRSKPIFIPVWGTQYKGYQQTGECTWKPL